MTPFPRRHPGPRCRAPLPLPSVSHPFAPTPLEHSPPAIVAIHNRSPEPLHPPSFLCVFSLVAGAAVAAPPGSLPTRGAPSPLPPCLSVFFSNDVFSLYETRRRTHLPFYGWRLGPVLWLASCPCLADSLPSHCPRAHLPPSTPPIVRIHATSHSAWRALHRPDLFSPLFDVGWFICNLQSSFGARQAEQQGVVSSIQDRPGFVL